MTRDHPFMVQHSQFHTQGWRANGDISIILSKSDPSNPDVNDIIAAEDYISGYACKGDPGTGAVIDLFHDMVKSTEDTDMEAKSLCTKLLMKTVSRDISSVEATYELSALPLVRCSLNFQNMSMSGARLLERHGSTVTKQSSLDRYLNRDNNDVSSWYSFVCNRGYVPVVSGGAHKCPWPLSVDYCRTMLLLHFPNWRKLSDIKSDSENWIDAFISFLNSPLCPNFVKADAEKAQTYESNFSQTVHEDDLDMHLDKDEQPEWLNIMKPLCEFTNSEEFEYDDGGPEYDWTVTNHAYPPDLGTQFLDQIPQTLLTQSDRTLALPDVEISNLNSEQKFAFDLVIDTLLQYKTDSKEFQPLRLVVGGTAGSGKSYLINCMVKAIRILFDYNNCVQIACPTGNAANLISGMTIHRFLKVPTSNKNKDMCHPKGKAAEQLQNNCKGLKVLLVDERSLIGCNTLGWMEFLCSFALKCDKSWGGLPVVVFLGDDIQFPPVLDSPLYHPKASSPASIHGALVWKEFNEVVILKSIIRQDKTQEQLKTVLNALRCNTVTPEQTKWLQQFQWEDLKQVHGISLLNGMKKHGLFIFPTHAEEWAFNRSQLIETNKQHPIAKITAECQGAHAKHLPSDKCGGLEKVLFLCVGAKVMLTSNLMVHCGLFNGSSGKVIDIVYPEGHSPSTSLPSVVMVEFDKYTGPPFIDERPKIVPICPVKRRLECPCFTCTRTQIPLRLGWGSTIHRCQGMTVGKNECYRYIVIHPGPSSFEAHNPGALFVALSRAKSAGNSSEDPDFAWGPSVLLNHDRVCSGVDTPTTRARSVEIIRLAEMAKVTKAKHQHILSASSKIKFFYENNLPCVFKPNIEE